MSVRPLVAALLWLTVAVHTFGGLDRAIGDGDESFHAEIVQAMLRTGHVADARWQGVTVLQRPQTAYWLALPFAKLIPGEIGLRFSSALCSFAILIGVFMLARKSFERDDAAWLATLLLAGSPFFHSYSRTLMSEPPFVLALTLALGGALQALRDPRGLRVSAIGLGLAVAVKSLAAAVPALVLAPWLLFAARRHRALKLTLQALGVLIALALPYYAIELVRYGEVFWNEHIAFHLVKRAVGGYGLGLGGSPFAYLSEEWALEGPFACAWLLLGTLGALALGLRQKIESLALLGSYGLGVLVLMSLLSMKLPHYLLPMHVAAALGAAGCFAHWVERSRVSSAFALVVLVSLAGGVASARYQGGDAWLLQRDQGKQLGVLAKAATKPSEVVYAYEWYGPALGLYAERRCVLLTAQPERFKSINFDTRERARGAMLTPPGPEPVGSHIVIAGPADELARAPWLEIEKVLGLAQPYFLVRGRIRASAPPQPTAAGALAPVSPAAPVPP